VSAAPFGPLRCQLFIACLAEMLVPPRNPSFLPVKKPAVMAGLDAPAKECGGRRQLTTERRGPIDAVDLVCHAVGFAWNGAKAFCEVNQAIYTLGVVIEHEQQRAGDVFRPLESYCLPPDGLKNNGLFQRQN
jgi:hypothetical protein